MKKFLFSFFFFSLMIVGAQAQSKAACSKTCTKSETAACKAKAPSTASTAMTSDVDYNASAAKLAANDPNIQAHTCPVTGSVSYSRKETNAAGQASLVDVSYDAATNSFVNVSPVKAEGTGAGCGSKATTVSGTKSGCSTGAAQGKSCCAGKGAAAKSAEKVKS